MDALTTTKLSSSWRTQVREQIWRLDNDVALLRTLVLPSPQLEQVEAGVRRAREAVEARSSLPDWWSGHLVEQAWGGLHTARAELILLHGEHNIRAPIT